MNNILQAINERSSFVISGHTGPDGDCIGACYGLAFALEMLGKNVTVVLEPYPQKYNIIPGHKFFNTQPVDELEVDVLIALDCADVSRLGPGLSLFDRAKLTICIDHHKTNIGFAQLNYIRPNASSTCEIVFGFIEQLVQPNVEIATAIYAGMVCDTGGFKYNATAKSTMEITARLMEIGIPFTDIYDQVLHIHSFEAAKAKGIILANAKQTLGGRVTYSYITREELEDTGAEVSDLDGVVEYLRDTRGTDVAALIYEKQIPKQFKMSLRSRGPDVSAVATAMGGGGHVLAAACTTYGEIESIIAQALQLIEKEIIDYDRRSKCL